MPEADRSAEQLRRRNGEGRVPEQIVEPRRDPPRAQGVEQDRVRIARFVGVVLVEQLVTGMCRIEETFELHPQHVHLAVVQKADTRQIALPVVEVQLLVAQAVFGPIFPSSRLGEEIAHRAMRVRKVVSHAGVPWGEAGVPPPFPNSEGIILRAGTRDKSFWSAVACYRFGPVRRPVPAKTDDWAARPVRRGQSGGKPPHSKWPMTVGCENGRLGRAACSARPKRRQAAALQKRAFTGQSIPRNSFFPHFSGLRL